MKCGSCKQSHSNVAEVRACYGIQTTHQSSDGQLTVTPRIPAKPATKPQLKFISDLEKQADLSPHKGTLTLQEASDLITGLKILLAQKPAHSTYPEAGPNEQDEYTKRRDRRLSHETSRAPYPDVPAGHYAVPSLTGTNDLDFFRVDRPTKGQWKGRTFVKRVIGGRPSAPVRGATARKALEAILNQGVELAAMTYGQEIGRCYKCNRHLTDETSRSLGIGPDCRAR